LGVGALVATALGAVALTSCGAAASARHAVTTTAIVTTTPAPSTTATTAAPTTVTTELPATTTTVPIHRYPTSVPAGHCTAAAIKAVSGVTPATDIACKGPWTIDQQDCTQTIQLCETYEVYRWTDAGWTSRGQVQNYCQSSISVSGIPPAIARAWGGPFDPASCPDDATPRLLPEPPTGPLSYGDQGPRVQALQQALIDRGLLADVADGQFGPNTEAALIDFKYLVGIPVTSAQGQVNSDQAGPDVLALLGVG
jgi:hypothetical protein